MRRHPRRTFGQPAPAHDPPKTARERRGDPAKTPQRRRPSISKPRRTEAERPFRIWQAESTPSNPPDSDHSDRPGLAGGTAAQNTRGRRSTSRASAMHAKAGIDGEAKPEASLTDSPGRKRTRTSRATRPATTPAPHASALPDRWGDAGGEPHRSDREAMQRSHQVRSRSEPSGERSGPA